MLVPLWFVGICPLLSFVLDPLRVGVLDVSEVCLSSFAIVLFLVCGCSCVVCLALSKLVPECFGVFSPFRVSMVVGFPCCWCSTTVSWCVLGRSFVVCVPSLAVSLLVLEVLLVVYVLSIWSLVVCAVLLVWCG